MFIQENEQLKKMNYKSLSDFKIFTYYSVQQINR